MSGIVTALLLVLLSLGAKCYGYRVDADNESIEALVEKYVDGRLDVLESLVEKQQYEIEMLSQATVFQKREILELHGMCDVRYVRSINPYEEYCSFGIISGADKLTLHGAKLLCEQKGAKIGNVYSKDHCNDLLKYFRPWINTRLLEGNPSIGIVTGMTFDPKLNILSLTSGEEASSDCWAAGYPVLADFSVEVALSVWATHDERNGILNYIPKKQTESYDSWFGAVCEVLLTDM